MVIFLPGHSPSLKIMIHSNFLAVGQTRYSCSFRFLCARLHTVIIRFLHLISQKMRQPSCLVKKFCQYWHTSSRLEYRMKLYIKVHKNTVLTVTTKSRAQKYYYYTTTTLFTVYLYVQVLDCGRRIKIP